MLYLSKSNFRGKYMETIGQKIKRMRLEKGLTQKDLAALLGTSQQNLAQYEKDKRRPKIETVRKIAKALDVCIGDLIDDWSIYPKKDIISDLKLNDAVTEKSPVNTTYSSSRFNVKDYQDLLSGLRHSDEEIKKMVDCIKIAIPAERPALLTQYFNQLNDLGQERAVEYTRLLARVPEYQKNPSTPSPAYNLPAAHKSESSDPDPEALQHESDE